MSPAEKVAYGLDLAAEGFEGLRAERIDLAARLARNREAFANGEGKALALRFDAHRGRDARVESQLRGNGGRRIHDGQRRTGAQMAAADARSLALYTPSGSGRRLPPARVGWWARLTAGGAGAEPCPRCGITPCQCSQRGDGGPSAPRLERAP